MTATITPASLRAHAEYMERVHLDGISAEELLQEAARLEAESARDEEAERLAQALFSGTAGHFVTASTWDAASDHSRNAFRAAARAALDFLAADGRLLPESGVATVAQHENVAADQHKWVYCEYQDFTRDCEFRCEAPGCDWSGQDKAGHAEHVHLIEAQERLRRNPETIASVQKAQAERHLDVRVEVVPPTSAPDILVHSHGPAEGRGLECPERMVDGRLRGACMDEAPDGTPEKPWPTWQDVPEGVKYAGVDDGGQLAYINCGGVRYLLNGVSSCSTDSDMAAIAPFVRVDGGKA